MILERKEAYELNSKFTPDICLEQFPNMAEDAEPTQTAVILLGGKNRVAI